jgi:GNAT superfamily N-acetyltransferase
MKIAPLTRVSASVGSGTGSKAELALAGPLSAIFPWPGSCTSSGFAAFIRAGVQKRSASCVCPSGADRAIASGGRASKVKKTTAEANSAPEREAVRRASPPRASITNSLLVNNHSFPYVEQAHPIRALEIDCRHVEPQRMSNGVSFDPELLNGVERRFWRGIWETIPAQVGTEHGVEARDFGPVQATVAKALPAAQMLNLVLGAEDPSAVAGGHLSAALDWIESRQVSFYVPLAETVESEGARRLLESRRYERGYSWMKFVRDAHPPRFSPPAGVEVFAVEDEAEPFGMIAATGFGLPPWASAFFAGLHRKPGWRCYLARVDGEAAACAAMFLHDGLAELGIAATLEPARGRGCQTALLHRRIADAAAAGCHTLCVKTGERIPGHPSTSYGNILRAGFEEAYLRPNWQRPAGIG